MGVELLTVRHKDQIAGVLSCYDRIILFQPNAGDLCRQPGKLRAGC
jgi:hypothetical protein